MTPRNGELVAEDRCLNSAWERMSGIHLWRRGGGRGGGGEGGGGEEGEGEEDEEDEEEDEEEEEGKEEEEHLGELLSEQHRLVPVPEEGVAQLLALDVHVQPDGHQHLRRRRR